MNREVVHLPDFGCFEMGLTLQLRENAVVVSLWQKAH